MMVTTPHPVRHALARLTALVVLGLSLAAVVGVSSPRVGVRVRSRDVRSASRSGMQRLDSMDAHLHEHEEPASVQVAADDATGIDVRPTLPGLAVSAASLAHPAVAIRLSSFPPSASPRSHLARLTPPGRAPPSA